MPPTAVQKVLPDISARSSLNTRAGRGRISSISMAIAAIYHMSINTPTAISGENRTIMLFELSFVHLIDSKWCLRASLPPMAAALKLAIAVK